MTGKPRATARRKRKRTASSAASKPLRPARPGVRSKRSAAIDAHLAAATAAQRAALEKLRRTIRSAAPAAEECIAYGIPAFRLNGRFLVGFAATKNHCAFYPGSSVATMEFRDELRMYDTAKGTIRFQPERPISPDLVRRLVRARIGRLPVRPALRQRRGAT